MKPAKTFAEIALAYQDAIHAARRASVDAEPEALLTAPVGELFKPKDAERKPPKGE